MKQNKQLDKKTTTTKFSSTLQDVNCFLNIKLAFNYHFIMFQLITDINHSCFTQVT